MAKARTAADTIEAEKQALIPTPRLGQTVLWYARGAANPMDPEAGAVPAIVTRIENFGRVTLTLIGGTRGAQKAGVRFKGMDGATDQSNGYAYRNGCWGFMVGDEPKSESAREYQVHMKSISERQSQINRAEARRDSLKQTVSA